jgi:hypothetical protein
LEVVLEILAVLYQVMLGVLEAGVMVAEQQVVLELLGKAIMAETVLVIHFI